MHDGPNSIFFLRFQDNVPVVLTDAKSYSAIRRAADREPPTLFYNLESAQLLKSMHPLSHLTLYRVIDEAVVEPVSDHLF